MADPFVALASGADAKARETLPLLSEYGYDFEKHRFRYDENGNNITVTEDEALKVWIYKALMTERYRYLAYHDEYGITIEPYQGTMPNSRTWSGNTSWNGEHAHTFDTGNAGGGTAHNNMQPSIVVYMFQRTG